MDGDKAASFPSNPFVSSYIDPSRSFSVRLLKEQHDTLEAYFQAEHKPSSATKKELAASLSSPIDKVNVRAKMKCAWFSTNMRFRIGFRIEEQRSNKTPRRNYFRIP